MAEHRLSHVRRSLAMLARNDRFLSPRMVAAIVTYLLVAASYLQAKVTDDAAVYYDLMRRLAGEEVDAYAYQFGVVIWNLPFYVVSRAVRAASDDEWIEHVQIGAVSVAVASTVAIVALFYVSWRLIREVGLPGGPGAILLTVFGSPLFYYAIFQPGYKHAFDTLLVSVLALLLLRATLRPPTAQIPVLIGLVLALLISVRYANVTLLAGVIYVFARRGSPIHAYVATATATVAATAILSLPFLLGIPYGTGPSEPAAEARAAATTVRIAAASTVLTPPNTGESMNASGGRADPELPAAAGGVDSISSFEIDVFAPVKMLFTVRRGLFVWTPLTFFGVLGFLLLLHRERNHRTFLAGLGMSALALLSVHIVWGGFWAGGFSFSQRFLTALFPLFVLGVAELLSRTRLLISPVLVLCVAWTAFLALHHFYGYDRVSHEDGADRIVELYRTGEETSGTFWAERLTDPVARHWQAYFDWIGLSSRD